MVFILVSCFKVHSAERITFTQINAILLFQIFVRNFYFVSLNERKIKATLKYIVHRSVGKESFFNSGQVGWLLLLHGLPPAFLVWPYSYSPDKAEVKAESAEVEEEQRKAFRTTTIRRQSRWWLAGQHLLLQNVQSQVSFSSFTEDLYDFLG